MMASNGPFCKGIENDKGNIFESDLWEKTFDVRFFYFDPFLITNATSQTLCFNYTDLLKIEYPFICYDLSVLALTIKWRNMK